MSRSGCGGRICPRSCPDLRARRWWWCRLSADYAAGTGAGWNAAPHSAGRLPRPGCVCWPPGSTTASYPGCCPMLSPSTRAATRQRSSLTWSWPGSPTSPSARDIGRGPGGRGAGGGGRPAAARRECGDQRCAYPSMLSRRLPTLIASPPVALAAACPSWRPAREPADAECLSAGWLGAVGAEVPAVDLIDPWQVPRRTGRGGQVAAEPAGDQVLEAMPRLASALVAGADPAGHAVAGPRSPAGGPIRSSPAWPIGAAWSAGPPCSPLERDRGRNDKTTARSPQTARRPGSGRQQRAGPAVADLQA